jgi:hypothetical protein
VALLRRYLGQAVPLQEAVPGLYLQSPNGKVYKVTIADDGTLSAVHVQGGP